MGGVGSIEPGGKSSMREVTLFWKRDRLHLSDVGPVKDLWEHAMHLGYIERNPQSIRTIIRCKFKEGKGPSDIDDVSFIELDEVISEPKAGDDAHMIIVRVSHPLTHLAARVGKLTIKPGSRLDHDGIHYILRGSPISIRIIVTAARLMLRPDHIKASNLSPDDMLEAELLSERQLEVLEAALDLGWYEVPRKVTLAELAKHLDLGRSTVSEHLVRAESAIIQQFLQGEPTFLD